MNKKKIELQVLNISNSQAQAGAYAMVLGEINGPRQLPVIIGSAEAQSMMIEMRGIVPPRPLTHTLYMKAEETILRIDARTSDAVALALRMDAPIFVYDDILEAECLKTEHSITPMKEQDPDKAPATQQKTLEQLKTALQNAIDEEDYERAAQLRDIINQHKKQ